MGEQSNEEDHLLASYDVHVDHGFGPYGMHDYCEDEVAYDEYEVLP